MYEYVICMCVYIYTTQQVSVQYVRARCGCTWGWMKLAGVVSAMNMLMLTVI